MKVESRFTRMDLAVILFCIVFLLMNLGVISGGARRRAKKLVCLSNLRTWGKVFQMYAEDNDGSTISDEVYNQKWDYNPYIGVPAGECWMSLLMSSYEDEQLRLCPMATITWGGNIESFGRNDRAWEIPPGAVEFAEGGIGSYGINVWCYNPPPQQEDGPWGYPLENCWRTVNVSGADEIPLFMDCIHIGFICQAWVSGYVGEPTPIEDRPFTGDGVGYGRICMNRHGNGTTNALFLDFSARSVGLKELWTLRFAKDGGGWVWDTCNKYTLCGGATSEDWDEWAPWMKDFKDY
ncbi:hypothetical protein ACFL1G_02060 [Planctomycetota bacterium]